MNDYPRFHQHRVNLLIHILVVPVFVAGALATLWSLIEGRWLWAGLLATAPVVSMALQGVGHQREPVPPLPFQGPVDVLRRIFAEQFYKFPRFVLSGGWLRAWRAGTADRR